MTVTLFKSRLKALLPTHIIGNEPSIKRLFKLK